MAAPPPLPASLSLQGSRDGGFEGLVKRGACAPCRRVICLRVRRKAAWPAVWNAPPKDGPRYLPAVPFITGFSGAADTGSPRASRSASDVATATWTQSTPVRRVSRQAGRQAGRRGSLPVPRHPAQLASWVHSAAPAQRNVRSTAHQPLPPLPACLFLVLTCPKHAALHLHHVERRRMV